MNTQHTPGPWTVYDDGNSQWPGIEAAHVSIVIFGDDEDAGIRGRTKKEAQANARLIAAVPELLAALLKVEQLITRDSDDLGFHLKMAAIAVEDAEALRAAIAKAVWS